MIGQCKGLTFPLRGSAVLLFLVIWLFSPTFLFSASPPIEHNQPELVYPQLLEMNIQTDDTVRAVRFYFLRPGFDQYQMRFMKPVGGGSFVYQFDTSTLDSPVLQYYFEVYTDEGMFLFPDDAPVTHMMIEGDRDGFELNLSEAPAKLDATEEEIASTGSVTLNGSIEVLIERDKTESETSEDGEQEDTSRFADDDVLVDLNLGVARTWEIGETSISFDMNVAYTSHPLDGEEEGSVSSFLFEVQRPHHHLRIGDLEVVSTKLAGESLNSRGIDYQYSRGRFTGEVYYLNSRQSNVLEDSIPSADNYITGVKLGVDVVEDLFHIDLHYAQGKDDSSILSIHTSDSDTTVLEGELFSIAPSLTLFDQSLTVSGEYVASYSSKETISATIDGIPADEADSDDFTDESDTAWRAGLTFEKWGLKVSGFYKYIGPNYQSLVNLDEQYFSVDREGYDLTVEYSTEKWDVLVTWEDTNDNLDDDSSKGWSRYQQVSITPRWQVTDNFSISVGHTNGQERTYEDSALSVRESDFDNFGYTAGIDYSFSDSSTVQLTWAMDIAESFDTPESDSTTHTVTFNYSYYDEKLQLYPGVSYSTTDTEEEISETINVYLSGEYSIIIDLLSLSTNNSITWTSGEVTADTRLITLSASIKWHLGWIHGYFSDTILSLVGEYEEDDQEDTRTESYLVSTKLDFMF